LRNNSLLVEKSKGTVWTRFFDHEAVHLPP
jgi:hypothetical protein